MKKTRDDFELWLFYMDDLLEPFVDEYNLDYSVDSLIKLEKIILSELKDFETATSPINSDIVDLFARYLGEVIRFTTGGIWNINLDRPEDVYFSLPIIQFGKYAKPCPQCLVTTSVLRNQGNYLFNLVKHFEQTATKDREVK